MENYNREKYKAMIKPLGRKNYGSIPHLPTSRLGTGDWHISEGQAKICLEKKRDKNDIVIVQEKLDGSNVGVAKVNGEIIPLTRSGYRCDESIYPTHTTFAEWVKWHEHVFSALLNEGERVCGEWLGQAVGTRYNLTHEPFVAFDIMMGVERLPYTQFNERVQGILVTPLTISIGEPFPLESAIECIKVSGHGAIDPVEGVIYRVERDGKVDFLAKYVHHFKQDGKYFPENNNGLYLWNINTEKYKTAILNTP